MKCGSDRRGLTIVEVIVALILLSVGVLATLSTTAFAMRTMTRGRMADMAAAFSGGRMEKLRLTTCATQTSGADTLRRSGQDLVTATWTTATAGNSTWKIRMVTNYMAERQIRRTVVSETEVSCLQ